MSDPGNTKFLEGSGASPNSCNKESCLLGVFLDKFGDSGIIGTGGLTAQLKNSKQETTPQSKHQFITFSLRGRQKMFVSGNRNGDRPTNSVKNGKLEMVQNSLKGKNCF